MGKMAVPPSFLDEIRARITLSSVVGRHVKLQRKGNEYEGLCPFHNEKTPSFRVTDEKDFYHCFGCGAHGDAFGFTMHTEGLTFMESIEKLAGEAGLEMPVQSPQDQVMEKKRLSLYEVCELACQFYQTSLYSSVGAEALTYIKNRGISDDIRAQYRLGYAPDGMALVEFLKSNNVEENAIIEAGLVRRGDRGLYSFFRNRVMFPIADVRGRIIAFGGRFMGNEKQAGVGKYVNSPETPLFDKGRVLYNLKEARAKSREENRLIVVEGYMDVIALTQAGFKACVAPLGTAMTEQQILQVWKSVPEPVLCFDGDNAGKKAALRAVERVVPILKAGYSISVAFMPQGKDPDDLIKEQGAPAMEAILHKSSTLVDFLWNDAVAHGGVDTPERLARLERHLNNISSSIGDATVSANYKSAFRNRLWDNFKSRKYERKGQYSNNKGQYSSKMAPVGGSASNAQCLNRRQQQMALAGLINYVDVFIDLEERFANFFTETDLKNAFKSMQSAVLSGLDDRQEVLEFINNDGYSMTVASTLNNTVYSMAKMIRPNKDSVEARVFLEHLLEMVEIKSSTHNYARIALEKASDEDSQEKLGKIILDARINESRLIKEED